MRISFGRTAAGIASCEATRRAAAGRIAPLAGGTPGATGTMTIVMGVVLSTAVLATSDWLHWAGPTYNFSAGGAVSLAPAWPAEGPRRLWTRSLGEGFAAVLADEQTVYAAFRRDGQELIAALEAASGRTRWERGFETPDHPEWRMPTGKPVAGPGPFATPLVAGRRLFFATSLGALHALDVQTGKPLWTRNLWTDLHGNETRPGYASSPIAYKDRLIVNVGGPGRGLVCLRQDTGEPVWSAVDAQNAFASPILIDVGGQAQVVAFMQKEIVGVDPDAGRLLWRHAHVTQHDVHASTPVWGPDNILFVSSAYDGGSRALQLSRGADGATTVAERWQTRRVRVHHTNALRIGGHVYASNGDFGPAPLTAVDIRTGAIAWQERRFGKSTLVGAGAHAVLLDEAGKLALITLSPQGLTVHAEADVLSATSWTVPTLVGSRLYLRNQRDVAAFELPTASTR